MRLFTTAALALALATPVLAQSSADVHFEAGNFGTMLSGSIAGNDYFDYKLGANAGQSMFVELKPTGGDGDGTIYFNILPPGSTGEAIFVGSMDADGDSANVGLPASGEYTIRVYLMGNDRDAGKTVDYNVDVSIQ